MRQKKVLIRAVMGVVCGMALLASSSWAAEGLTDNKFAFNLYNYYAQRDGNFFFSPYSLSIALGIACEGARGRAADEIRTALGLSSDDGACRSMISEMTRTIRGPGKVYEISMANALWAEKGTSFTRDYRSFAAEIYSSQTRNLDFIMNADAARGTINKWISEETKERIQDFIPEGVIDSTTQLVLTNVVCFKGQWGHLFKRGLTKKEMFRVSPDRSVQVDMMTRHGEYRYFGDNMLEVVEIPYEREDLSMFIFAPRIVQERVLSGDFTPAAIDQWKGRLVPEDIVLSLPRFQLSLSYALEQDLPALGMGAIFDTEADLSGMFGGPGLFVNNMIHEAWIDVDERGSGGFLATAIRVVKSPEDLPWFPTEPKTVRIDRPFVFIIQENKTGRILFMGRVVDPAK